MKVTVYTGGYVAVYDEVDELSFVNDGSYGPAENFEASSVEGDEKGLFVNFAKVLAVEIEGD